MNDVDLNNAWKNKKVFEKQLKCNLHELSSKDSYPPHWNASLELISHYEPKTILDVGCGCGAFCEVCFRNLPNLLYTGMDYSEDAIRIAKENFNESAFFVKDVMELTKEDVEEYDLVFMGALLDVRSDANEILEHVLSLKPKSLLLSRVKLTESDSYIETYEAYDEIETCAFYHNVQNFVDMCKRYGYDMVNIQDNYYLTLGNEDADTD